MPTSGLDWAEFANALTYGLAAAIRDGIAGNPDQHFYVAALDHVYRERDGVISLPDFAMDSTEAKAERNRPGFDEDTADWWYFDDSEWPAGDLADRWHRALVEEACSATVEHWDATFARYLDALVEACKRARAELRDSGVVSREFIVVLIDEEYSLDGGESLLRRVLSEKEFRRHYPRLEKRANRLRRVCALSPAKQAAYFVARLDADGEVVSSEDAQEGLRHLGRAAVTALLPLLGKKGKAWEAAMLLAEVGLMDDEVATALVHALIRNAGPDQLWAARALAVLGRLDLVLGLADRVPEEAVVVAAAAPYKSRGRAVNPLALDYQPLEEVLRARPALAPAVEEELRPGVSCCSITVDEVPEAIRGLRSPYAIVRSHAAQVLGERGLGAAVGGTVVPLLTGLARDDPDETVRRMTGLSLRDWKVDPTDD